MDLHPRTKFFSYFDRVGFPQPRSAVTSSFVLFLFFALKITRLKELKRAISKVFQGATTTNNTKKRQEKKRKKLGILLRTHLQPAFFCSLCTRRGHLDDDVILKAFRNCQFRVLRNIFKNQFYSFQLKLLTTFSRLANEHHRQSSPRGTNASSTVSNINFSLCKNSVFCELLLSLCP